MRESTGSPRSGKSRNRVFSFHKGWNLKHAAKPSKQGA